jgi:hypothetical protein
MTSPQSKTSIEMLHGPVEVLPNHTLEHLKHDSNSKEKVCSPNLTKKSFVRKCCELAAHCQTSIVGLNFWGGLSKFHYINCFY